MVPGKGKAGASKKTMVKRAWHGRMKGPCWL